MPQNLEKIIAHDARELAPQDARPVGPLAERLPQYKKFLRIENHRLRLAHQAGGGGREICRRRVQLLDVFLRRIFADAVAACLPGNAGLPALDLVAIGGYGRGELNPFSDVDILFLHDFDPDSVPDEINELIKQVLYALWDIGFKVGHATRSIREACEHANRDNVSKTALVESRHLAGPRALFTEFQERFEQACVRGQEAAYLAWRLEDQRVRHQKYGPTVFLQEPNIKSSPGGLRDYHNLIWSLYFKEARVRSLAELSQQRLINESERRTLEKAYDFLLRVRTDLHYLTRRSTDALTLHFQGQIADRFGYPQKTTLRRSEAFMRDYYHHARALLLITDNLFQRLIQAGPITPENPATGLLRLFGRHEGGVIERFDGFLSQDGQIYPETRDVFNQDPVRLLRVFEHAQTRHLRLSSELQQLIRRRAWLVNRTFQYARAARETFISILSRRGQVGRVLRAMHEVDLLGAYLPEFGELTCLVQHEFFHRYSADEHTLVCIEKLDGLLARRNTEFQGYRELFDGLDDPFVLYLALLLHDTGKATGAKHHAEASALFAQKVAARLQLSPERRRSLILLVDHHITMSQIAQRRNLEDPATVAEFANSVRDRANLDALMLLTFADGQGTSDDNWSDWKESLVWQLYRATTRYLADGEAAYLAERRARDTQRAAVATALDPSYPDEIEAHFSGMPTTYFETFGPRSIVDHLRLVREFLARRGESEPADLLAPAVSWQPYPDRGHTECRVCTWERKGLFARIAGSFAAAGLNILSADIFTRADNIAVDIFRVCDSLQRAVTEKRDFAAVETVMGQALGPEPCDFGPLLQQARRRRHQNSRLQELDFPTRTVITNEATDLYTLLEVQTPDRLGLLYDLLRALGRLRINVVLSRIATEKGAAIDSFYLLDEEGGRIVDSALQVKIQSAVQQAAVKAS